MALRYFRCTFHPLSDKLNAQGQVQLRMQFPQLGANGQLVDRWFEDGEWFSIADGFMGTIGVHFDFMIDELGGPGGETYLMFQEGVFDPPSNPPAGVIAFASLLQDAEPVG